VLRIYVDNEESASIAGPIGLLHGIGFDAKQAPWSAGASFGKDASLGGGIWSSHKIPFGVSIRITVQPVGQRQDRGFYFMARGLLGYRPIVLPHSFLSLPEAARLRVLTTQPTLLFPLDYVTWPASAAAFSSTSSPWATPTAWRASTKHGSMGNGCS